MRGMVQRMATPSTFHLHDQHLQGQLGPMLLNWRTENRSAEEITYLLRSEHQITVSAATVLRWVAIAEEAAA